MLSTAVAVGTAMLTTSTVCPMSRTATEVLLSMVMNKEFKLDWEKDEAKIPLACKIAKRRAEWAGFTIDDPLLVMIGALCDRPGTVVMYCAAMKALGDKLGRSPTIDDLCEAFPMGFPTEGELARIWDEQKVHDGSTGSDNWLDREAAWAA